MGSMEDVIKPSMEDDDEERSDDDKVYRVRVALIPIFFLEAAMMGALGLLAYHLRFTEWLPVLERGFNPCDPGLSLPKHPQFGNGTAPLMVDPTLWGALVLGVPPILLALGEMLYFLFSSSARKVVRAGCLHCKLHKFTRRLFRFLGMFVFGALACSVLVDILKASTGCPRPYFLEECGVGPVFCQQVGHRMVPPDLCPAVAAADPRDLRLARMSFPSFHVTISAYSVSFITLYIHQMARVRCLRVVRPTILAALGAMLSLDAVGQVVSHRSHMSDVLAGALLGGLAAFYLVRHVLNNFQEHFETRGKTCCSRRRELNPRPPLFFRYFKIPEMTFQTPQGPVHVNEAFQRDLHQKVEDFNKRCSDKANNKK